MDKSGDTIRWLEEKGLFFEYVSGYSENMIYNSVPNNGDGLMMAMEVGAGTEGLGTLLLHFPIYPDPKCISLTDFILSGYTVWVNKKGERFADESLRSHPPECGNAVGRQPDNCAIVIFVEPVLSYLSVLMEWQLKFQCVGQFACPGKYARHTGWYKGLDMRPGERDLQKAQTFIEEIIEDNYIHGQ